MALNEKYVCIFSVSKTKIKKLKSNFMKKLWTLENYPNEISFHQSAVDKFINLFCFLFRFYFLNTGRGWHTLIPLAKAAPCGAQGTTRCLHRSRYHLRVGGTRKRTT